MNPKCARCQKTVYPMEKLNCLDKYWHKQCFKCETCDMTLSMKTYKGYNKMPFCNAHYPSTKFTAVADTPENLRLAKNTAQQSGVVYHKEFETDKGKYTAVDDDPETRRLKKNTQQTSDLQYKGHIQTQSGVPGEQAPAPSYKPAQPVQPPPQPVAAPVAVAAAVVRYRALYDYAAADEDEVSFNEGDIIVNVEVIDDGWMTGKVESTGQSGMLPANYVEKN